ncbi:MAG: ABC transporter ATP-binding protein [Armatimonadota bacterium]
MPEVLLETTGLAKTFRRRRAVDDLSLRVYEGDVYGFLGPNGAGKSTTIRMLTGLVSPTAGTVRVLGRRIGASALRQVGALVETPAFYKYLSARENLSLLGRLSGLNDPRRVDEVLDLVGLLDRAKDKVKVYSQGMRQRLGIAQAILAKPKLVILDEPTNGLDPQGMRDVRELIRRLAEAERVTIFLSSHLLHEVEQVCTRVGIINRGRLVAEGDVGELLGPEDLVRFSVPDPARAAAVLSGLSWAEARAGEGAVSVRAPAERFPELNRTLVSAGVDVRAMVPNKSTLEELFLELVEERDD